MADRDFVVTGSGTNKEVGAQCSSLCVSDWHAMPVLRVITGARAIMGKVVLVTIILTSSSISLHRPICSSPVFLQRWLVLLSEPRWVQILQQRVRKRDFHNPGWPCHQAREVIQGFQMAGRVKDAIWSWANLHLSGQSLKVPFTF